MKVILNEKALYIVFPVDKANVDSSLSDLSVILRKLVETDFYSPICKGVLAIKRNQGEQK